MIRMVFVIAGRAATSGFMVQEKYYATVGHNHREVVHKLYARLFT